MSRLTAAIALATIASQPAYARRAQITIPAGSLAKALASVAIQTQQSLLFPPEIVGDLRSPPYSGSADTDTIVRILLKNSGLSFRRSSRGTIIIFRDQQEPEQTIPQILVIGRKTQNADIRRTENDIQPYHVITSRQITSARSDNIDQFFRERVPANAVLGSPSQNGSNRSEINLHSLGASQTLVLVDGARMPRMPALSANLQMVQPDINGVPLAAIERVEVLTGTAGAIFGPGATGGVVNVVIKRDYRGADISGSTGLSDRGDGARRRIEARLGLTPDGGATAVMLLASYTTVDGLRQGDRDYALKAQRLRFGQNQEAFVGSFPSVNGLLVHSLDGTALTLKPDWGGTSLGKSFTYLPIGYAGTTSDGGAALSTNAGKIPDALSPYGLGRRRALTVSSRATSLLLNARHRFGDHIEGFVDLVGYNNSGRTEQGPSSISIQSLSKLNSVNPFNQNISFSIPIFGFDINYKERLRTWRLATGVIFDLPKSWKAQVSYNVGGVNEVGDVKGFTTNTNFYYAFANGGLGRGGEPEVNPFGNWASFATAMQAYRTAYGFHYERRNEFNDATLRIAGPLIQRSAGTVNLTLLAEKRRERVPSFPPNGVKIANAVETPGFSETVSSLYSELRVPVIRRDPANRLLSGLEFQLAIRNDRHKSDSAERPGAAFSSSRVKVQHSASAYTAGFRLYPDDQLQLRASMATGILAPTPQQLLTRSTVFETPYPAADPRRAGSRLGSEAPFRLLIDGSPNLRPERARTMSFGFVLHPDSAARPRISVDYTHVSKRREISSAYIGNVAYFVANEQLYADRISRNPLSAEDVAKGYTGGIITEVDTTTMNVGRTELDALDLRGEHEMRFSRSRLTLYGAATWTLRLVRKAAPDRTSISYVGYTDGPLRWRGNFGLDWVRGPASVGMNVQYYGGYRQLSAGATPTAVATANRNYGNLHVRPQAYLDLSASRRFDVGNTAIGPRSLELRLGVSNLLDRSPEIAARSDLGYSYYGDARRRRFDLTATVSF